MTTLLVDIAEAHAIGTATTTATTTAAAAATERVIVIARTMAVVSTAMHPAHQLVKIVMVGEAMNVAVTTAVERSAVTTKRLRVSQIVARFSPAASAQGEPGVLSCL